MDNVNPGTAQTNMGQAPIDTMTDANSQAGQQQMSSMAMQPLKVAPTTANVPAPLNHTRPGVELFSNVPIELIFEVGRTNITIKQLMELCEGAFVELRHVSVDSIDVRVNEEIIAKGEAIAMQQWYGSRVGEVEIPPGLEIKQ